MRSELNNMVFESAMEYYKTNVIGKMDEKSLSIDINEYCHARYPEDKLISGFANECMVFVVPTEKEALAELGVDVYNILEQAVLVSCVNKTTLKDLLVDFASRLYHEIIDRKEAAGTLIPTV